MMNVYQLLQEFNQPAAAIPLTYLALFHVVNPIGSSVLFLNMTPRADNRMRRQLSQKIALNSFIIMLVTLLAGVYILKLFGITIPIVQICGGILIFAMGWQSINSESNVNDNNKQAYAEEGTTDENIYMKEGFYPLTFPVTVGPGTIAVMLTISAESLTGDWSNDILNFAGAGIAIVLMSITIFLCYNSANYIIGKMSLQMRNVIMKLFAFILLCIGGQITANGLHSLMKILHK